MGASKSPAAGGSVVRDAVYMALCCAPAHFDAGCLPAFGANFPHHGGFFAQLNVAVNLTLVQLLLGRRPTEPRQLYRLLPMYGYGGPVSCTKAREIDPTIRCKRGFVFVHGRERALHFGSFFEEFSPSGECSRLSYASADPHGQRLAQPTARLHELPRYLVMSHLMNALYGRPRLPTWLRPAGASPMLRAEGPHYLYSLAIHARRGDKLTEARGHEKIAVWGARQVVAQATKLLAQPADGDAGDEASGVKRRVLLASDDNAFAQEVAAALEALLGVSVHRLHNELEVSRTQEAASVCNASCVPPLLTMVQGFARSRRLMLNTKSNVGAFLLTYWPAANGDRMPPVFDMDRMVSSRDLAPDRSLCNLPYGSRRGFCSGGPSPEALAALERAAPCRLARKRP